MWVTKGRVWYSEEDMQRIVEHCTNVINDCRAESGHNLFAWGRMFTAQQILELLKEIKE